MRGASDDVVRGGAGRGDTTRDVADTKFACQEILCEMLCVVLDSAKQPSPGTKSVSLADLSRYSVQPGEQIPCYQA
jgi:hypothetical protein